METTFDRPPGASKSPVHCVLIVDDDPMVLEAISMMITAMGIDSHQARDGVEALELFQARSGLISLVIMDVEMPRLGGVEAALKIREIDPSAKLVLCSGHTKQDVWKAKPNAFLLKPFMQLELREIVHNLLRPDGLDP